MATLFSIFEISIIKRSSLKKNDLLVTIIGATNLIVGRSSLVKQKNLPANINQNIALIRTNNKYSSEYISIFINTYYGRNYLWYLSRQTEQVNLNCREVEKLLIPKVSSNFDKIISTIHKHSFKINDVAILKYYQAEQLLLSEIGLLDWKPKHQLTFIKPFLESKKANRIDADYFQPKYDEIIKNIKKYKDGWDTLGNLVKLKKCVEPGSDSYQNTGIPFIRVSNLSILEIKNNNQQYISEKTYTELKNHQPKQGEILLSKDATPGIAYFLNEKPIIMIPSGGILRLNIKNDDIFPEYLTLILNSVIVQKQIERSAGGSIIKHWRPDQVKTTYIPILAKEKQKTIKDKIKESFSLRKQSKQLLEIAKIGVEKAIEENENVAIKWIDDELKKLNVKL